MQDLFNHDMHYIDFITFIYNYRSFIRNLDAGYKTI